MIPDWICEHCCSNRIELNTCSATVSLVTKGTCPVTGRSEVQVTWKGVNNRPDARGACPAPWALQMVHLAPTCVCAPSQGTAALKKTNPMSAQGKGHHCSLDSFLLQICLLGGGDEWKEWYPEGWRETSVSLQHERTCTKGFPPLEE